ncbi:MAG: hypothetical protein D6710_08240 [Nitrospirae bacterium]|nr:MAG: hypothetical protein D6710_08240 [Nitrospirota bacterium]
MIIIDDIPFDLSKLDSRAAELLQDSVSAGKSPSLKLTVDATHSGRLTNMRVYPGAAVRRSAKTFLEPYKKPVLRNHDFSTDPIGRVENAKFIKLKDGEAFLNDFKKPDRGPGSGFIRLDLSILDSDAIEKFLDGRYQTFSTTQVFKNAFCSVCGQDVSEEMTPFGLLHEHIPGKVYDVGEGKRKKKVLAYMITGDLAYKEVSVVNIPADEYTKVVGLEFQNNSDDSKDTVIRCADADIMAAVDSLKLAVGDTEVDLLKEITRKDRQSMTDKVIVAVGPDFGDISFDEEEDMDNPDVKDVLDDEPVEDTQDNDANDVKDSQDEPNSTSDDASVASDDDPGQNDGSEAKQEGVVAPDAKTSGSSDSSDREDVSRDALVASIEALTSEVKALKAEKDELKSYISRLKATVAEKDEEVERFRRTAADNLAEAKNAYVSQLLNTRIILGKADVAGIKSDEDYKAAFAKYAERSMDSIKDSIEDLSIELSQFSNGMKTYKTIGSAKDTKVEPPVVNKSNNKPKKSDSHQKDPLRDFMDI